MQQPWNTRLPLVHDQSMVHELVSRGHDVLPMTPTHVPVLALMCKLRRQQQQSAPTAAAAAALAQQEQYVAAHQRHVGDLDVFCAQAAKLFAPSGAKALPPVPEHLFESARSVDRFWTVFHLLTAEGGVGEDAEAPSSSSSSSAGSGGSSDSSVIFNERAFVHVLFDIVPVVIGCFPARDLPLLLRPLLLSTLAAEHISNLVANLPSV